MKTAIPQKPLLRPLQGDLNFHKIEKIFTHQDSTNNLYSTSSENALYLLTDKNTFLIFEKNSTQKNHIQLKITNYTQKNETKLQTKEKNNQLWCDDSGNHVLIKTNGSLFYYNPYFKNDFNLKEIVLDYKSRYYLEIYSVAFNEEIKSQDEFEILVSDYNSEIYNIKFKIFDKKDITIEYFEKVHSFKSKFQLDQEKYIYGENEDKKENDDKEELYIDLDLDFDELNMITFDNGERIIDMKIYSSQNNEKTVIACTKNMIFKFIGKEQSYVEFFKKYSQNSELMMKSYRKFPNKSKALSYNSSHIQILPSYTMTQNKKFVFGCMGGYGYCLGEIEENSENKENDLENIIVINYKRPKHLGESKIPLFTLDENLINS